MGTLARDFLYGLRHLVRAPLFSLMTILSLAMGIGGTAAIFSVVRAVMLRPLPFQDPDRLVVAWESDRAVADDQIPVAPADFFDWQAQSHQLAKMAAFHPWSFSLSGQGDPEQVRGAVSTAELFDVMGKRPILGRTYTPAECRQGGPAVVVLGHDLWQRRFGADPKVLGRTLLLDDVAFTVIGVMPAGFTYPSDARLWKPFQSENYFSRTFNFLRVVARLAPGASAEGARRELAAIAARLERAYPDSNTGREATLLSLHEELVGKVRPRLRILFGGAFLLLLATCFNVANLLVARGINRRSEVALRQALGVSRRRLLTQLLVENFVLALAGGGVGLLVAYLGAKFLVKLGPTNVPRLGETTIDGGVLAFAAALTLFTGLFFGLLPAVQSSRPNLIGVLRTTRAPTRLRSLHFLVGLQIAVALTILVGAALLGRSFLRLSRVPPGFDPAQAFTFSVSLPPAKYDGARAAAFFEEAQARLAALPGVKGVGAALSLPMVERAMNVDLDFAIVGRPKAAAGQELKAFLRPATAGYFQSMKIPLRGGRLFSAADRAGAPEVVLVNETLARRYWPAQSPLRQRLTFGQSLGGLGDLTSAPREIVGVVGDVRHNGLASEPVPEIYVPTAQGTWTALSFVVRTSVAPLSLVKPALAEIWKLDKNLPADKIRTLDDVVSTSVAQPRFFALLLSFFAVFSLTLASLGVFGLMSYSVALRTGEIGVRMALGAQAGDVRKMVLLQSLGLVAAGILFGSALAISLGRFLSSLLFGVRATDPTAFAAAAFALSAVALLATYLPARRAVRVDPMNALRSS
jgi:predicted permease